MVSNWDIAVRCSNQFIYREILFNYLQGLSERAAIDRRADSKNERETGIQGTPLLFSSSSSSYLTDATISTFTFFTNFIVLFILTLTQVLWWEQIMQVSASLPRFFRKLNSGTWSYLKGNKCWITCMSSRLCRTCIYRNYYKGHLPAGNKGSPHVRPGQTIWRSRGVASWWIPSKAYEEHPSSSHLSPNSWFHQTRYAIWICIHGVAFLWALWNLPWYVLITPYFDQKKN